jgi:hypothetical protein
MNKIEKKIVAFEIETFEWENEIDEIIAELVETTDTHYIANVTISEVNGDFIAIEEVKYPKEIIDKF